MKSIFEQMGGTYRREGDYFVTNLELPDEDRSFQKIGKYGRMRQRYLKGYRKSTYTEMVLSGKLYKHLAEVEQTCTERMDLLVKQMAEREGVTEALKASAQLEWVGRMNNIRSRAEEIVLAEVVYK